MSDANSKLSQLAEAYQSDAVADGYDRKRFNSLMQRMFVAREEACIQHAMSGISTDSLILDVPCGTGRLAAMLLRRGYSVFGVDISPAMLRIADHRLATSGGRFTSVVHDAFDIPNLGRRFAAAICARILVHMAFNDQVKFLISISSAVNGPVVFTHSYDSAIQRSRSAVRRALGKPNPTPNRVTETN